MTTETAWEDLGFRSGCRVVPWCVCLGDQTPPLHHVLWVPNPTKQCIYRRCLKTHRREKKKKISTASAFTLLLRWMSLAADLRDITPYASAVGTSITDTPRASNAGAEVSQKWDVRGAEQRDMALMENTCPISKTRHRPSSEPWGELTKIQQNPKERFLGYTP